MAENMEELKDDELENISGGRHGLRMEKRTCYQGFCGNCSWRGDYRSKKDDADKDVWLHIAASASCHCGGVNTIN